MTKEDREQRAKMLEEITDYMVNVQTRGEQLEERMLDEMIAKREAEIMHILETEWADHRDMWEWMLQKGRTPKEVLELLDSFA